jgi:hypothetical protein
MNWDSERDMAKDVEENAELYEALADGDDDIYLENTHEDRQADG